MFVYYIVYYIKLYECTVKFLIWPLWNFDVSSIPNPNFKTESLYFWSESIVKIIIICDMHFISVGELIWRYFFWHQHGCTCAFTCRRMLHTTDPEFPSMIVSGNLPSLTLHVNEQKASTPLSSNDQINSRSLVFNLSGFFTWQCNRYGEIKTSNPVFMHWVDPNFLVPHLYFMIKESQTCHYHDGIIILNLFQVFK